ncbi:hypothetical protein EAO70_12165 [Streptomyces sp. adm13(2018)]|nr:hypothetical protein EAO70_12165 [Streptomyces sp. adm13(2018)]
MPCASEACTARCSAWSASGPLYRNTPAGVHDVLPPKTVYTLTGFGEELCAALAPLSDWGHRRLERLVTTPAAS